MDPNQPAQPTAPVQPAPVVSAPPTVSPAPTNNSKPSFLPKILIVAVLVVLIAVLGGGGYYFYNLSASPEKVLVKASEKFTKLKTVHADINISSTTYITDDQGLPTTTTSKITGFGDLNLTDKTQKMHLDLSASGNTFGMDTVLLTGGQIYMRLPILTEDWISINTQTLEDQGSLPIDPQSNDYVTQSLGFLKSANNSSIIKLQDEAVDGINTTHVRVDVSTPQYIAYLKQISNSSSLSDSFKDANVKTEIWIDKKTNYIIKMNSVVKNLTLLDPKTGGRLGSSDSTIDIKYSRFDQAVDISKPSGTTVNFEDLLNEATASAK